MHMIMHVHEYVSNLRTCVAKYTHLCIVAGYLCTHIVVHVYVCTYVFICMNMHGYFHT